MFELSKPFHIPQILPLVPNTAPLLHLATCHTHPSPFLAPWSRLLPLLASYEMWDILLFEHLLHQLDNPISSVFLSSPRLKVPLEGYDCFIHHFIYAAAPGTHRHTSFTVLFFIVLHRCWGFCCVLLFLFYFSEIKGLCGNLSQASLSESFLQHRLLTFSPCVMFW